MQAAVGGKQAESSPALIKIRRRGALESGDVMAPEGESAHGKGQAAAQRLRHGRIGRHAVTAPVDRKLLGSGRRTSRKENGVSLPLLLLEHLKDTAVIEQRVIIVHRHRIRAVVVGDVDRDPFPEICLKAVDSHRAQGAELLLEPAVCIGICKVNYR